ncbi:hypothetical protein [Streptomyces sp. NA04227]|nr:hypothetical protein [Streptomyces sp. NA04227]
MATEPADVAAEAIEAEATDEPADIADIEPSEESVATAAAEDQ